MSRTSKNGLLASGVPEVRTTMWHNPTKDTVSVVLQDPGNRQFRFTVPPGATVPLDCQYDRAIQLVDCGRPECHNRPAGGHYCNVGHSGLISGGQAPQLRRVGKDDKLEPCLDQALVDQKTLEQQLDVASRIATVQSQVAEDAATKLARQKATAGRVPRVPAPPPTE